LISSLSVNQERFYLTGKIELEEVIHSEQGKITYLYCEVEMICGTEILSCLVCYRVRDWCKDLSCIEIGGMIPRGRQFGR